MTAFRFHSDCVHLKILIVKEAWLLQLCWKLEFVQFLSVMAVLCCVLFCEFVCSQAATEADAFVMCVGHT